MYKKLFFFIAITVISANGYSNADHSIAVGPSVASVSGDNGISFNLDLSYTWIVFTPSLNFKYISTDEQKMTGAQFEFTMWVIANIGGGVGYFSGDEGGFVPHFFVGLPIPLGGADGYFEIFYFEPYYRANFFEETMHEYGIYVKISTIDIIP